MLIRWLGERTGYHGPLIIGTLYRTYDVIERKGLTYSSQRHAAQNQAHCFRDLQVFKAMLIAGMTMSRQIIFNGRAMLLSSTSRHLCSHRPSKGLSLAAGLDSCLKQLDPKASHHNPNCTSSIKGATQTDPGSALCPLVTFCSIKFRAFPRSCQLWRALSKHVLLLPTI